MIKTNWINKTASEHKADALEAKRKHDERTALAKKTKPNENSNNAINARPKF